MRHRVPPRLPPQTPDVINVKVIYHLVYRVKKISSEFGSPSTRNSDYGNPKHASQYEERVRKSSEYLSWYQRGPRKVDSSQKKGRDFFNNDADRTSVKRSHSKTHFAGTRILWVLGNLHKTGWRNNFYAYPFQKNISYWKLHASYHYGYHISQLSTFHVKYRRRHRLAMLNIPNQQKGYLLLLWLKYYIWSFESFGQISQH
jgi:hypothetical protein